MNKLFQRIYWHNNTTPALNETNLNAMSKGLSDVDDRVIDLADSVYEVIPQLQQALEDAQETLAEIQDTLDDVTALETKLEAMFERAIKVLDVWTEPVTCAINTASVTIRDTALHTTSYVEVWLDNQSGNREIVNNVKTTEGQCIVTFASPLAEATIVQLQIKNKLLDD